jgi:ribose transport system substrate-binding protein
MKRSLTFLVCTLVAVFAAFGCNGDSGSGGAVASGAMKDLTIAISIPSGDHGWTAGVNYWADEVSKMYPDVTWLIQKADNVEQQRTQVENMLAQSPDALVILCHESGPLDGVGRQAKEQGVYIVSVDRGFTDPTIADLFVEGDNVAFGRKSAEYMVVKLGADPKKLTGATGNILVFEGATSTVNENRVAGAMEVFRANPGIKILKQQQSNWKREDAFNHTETILVELAGQKIDAIWASDDDMAEGIEQAVKEAGRTDLWILGGAGKKTIVKRVMDKDPLYPADITYPPSMIATGIHMAVANLRDGMLGRISPFMPKHVKIDVELITPENAERYYFPDSPF